MARHANNDMRVMINSDIADGYWSKDLTYVIHFHTWCFSTRSGTAVPTTGDFAYATISPMTASTSKISVDVYCTSGSSAVEKTTKYYYWDMYQPVYTVRLSQPSENLETGFLHYMIHVKNIGGNTNQFTLGLRILDTLGGTAIKENSFVDVHVYDGLLDPGNRDPIYHWDKTCVYTSSSPTGTKYAFNALTAASDWDYSKNLGG